MILQLKGILKRVPVVLSELEDNFGILMKVEFTLMFAVIHVIDMIEKVDDLLLIFSAEGLDFIGERLFIKEWNFDDEDMSEDFELPKNLDPFCEFLELDECHVFETLVFIVFGMGSLKLEGWSYIRHCELDRGKNLQLVRVLAIFFTL